MKKIIYFCYYSSIILMIAMIYYIIKYSLVYNWFGVFVNTCLFVLLLISTACDDTFKEPREQMFNFINKYLK